MSVDCLLPETFTSIDPIHPDLGIDIINEMVADLHRHEEHIGENRSSILGSTADDISTELTGNVKSTLINVLAQIRLNLLVLISAEINGKKWCDGDESPYSGPNTIINDFNDHWLWPQIIDEIRDVLQNLLCICSTVPEGQELYFTLIPSLSQTFFSSLKRGVDLLTNTAWSKFLAADYSTLLEISTTKSKEIMTVSRHLSFTEYLSFSFQNTQNRSLSLFDWGLDATSLESINGIGNSEIRPISGDIFIEVVRAWVNIHSRFNNIDSSDPKIRDFQINSWPVTIELNEIAIWSKTLTTTDIIHSDDIFTDEIGEYVINPRKNVQEDGYINTPETIDIFSPHDVFIAVDNEFSQTPIANNVFKEWNVGYDDVSSGKEGILTVKVIRPAR